MSVRLPLRFSVMPSPLSSSVPTLVRAFRQIVRCSTGEHDQQHPTYHDAEAPQHGDSYEPHRQEEFFIMHQMFHHARPMGRMIAAAIALPLFVSMT